MCKTLVVFCPNQIAVTIAFALALRGLDAPRVVVIYWPDRCSVDALVAKEIECLPYSRMACIRVLLRYVLKGKLGSCVPHRKLGRVINFFSYMCSSRSLLDDGLDTLRDVPRNVDPTEFVPGTEFYTFNYPFELGKWLAKFRVQRIVELSDLVQSGRPMIDLRGVQQLVIESPPLGMIAHELNLTSPDTLVITHSNDGKRKIFGKGIRMVDGGAVAIERSLLDFSGTVIVGESMVTVYALSLSNARFQLHVYLPVGYDANLKPLSRMIESRNFAIKHLV